MVGLDEITALSPRQGCDMGWLDRILMVAVLVLAVMLHEIAHGLAALWCGDRTALEAGRISLNPLRHIDPFGTVILPLLLVVSGAGIVFGWARPVPVNLGRTRNPRRALWVTAAAGPLSNLVQALLAVLVLRGTIALGLRSAPVQWLQLLCVLAVLINVVLMLFNLLPVPPLDGSRVLAALLPPDLAVRYLSLGRFGFLIVAGLLYLGVLDRVLNPLIDGLFKVLLSGA